MKLSHEERRQKLIELSDRAPELNASAGSEIFQMEFVDYTDDDEYIVKYYIKPWQRNPFGNLQGGMLCYYIDAAAGTLSWVSVDCAPVGTVDINVTFIRGVPTNAEYILVKSKVISIGRRVVVASADVYCPADIYGSSEEFEPDSPYGWLMATAVTNTTRLLPPDPNPTIV